MIIIIKKVYDNLGYLPVVLVYDQKLDRGNFIHQSLGIIILSCKVSTTVHPQDLQYF
jgi:hypothetical protein